MTLTELSFRVRFDQDIRVGQLPEIGRDFRITRTAHIGNLNPAELALLALNVPLRLVDKNQSGLDKIHRPQSLLCNAREQQLTQQLRVLSPYLHDEQGGSLAYRHLAATREAFPQQRISTYSLDYLEHAEQVSRLLERLADRYPRMFDRWVSADGQVLKQQFVDDQVVGFGDDSDQLVTVKRSKLPQYVMNYFYGVKQVSETGEPMQAGNYVLLRAEADIILQAVIDTRDHSGDGWQRFYQCCGQAMARYIANPANNKSVQIAEIYHQLRSDLGDLPKIEMVLIPISTLRFAGFDQEGLAAYLAIVEQEKVIAELKQQRSQAVQAASKHREQVIDEYRQYQMHAVGELDRRISVLVDRQFNPFYDLHGPARVTQHDVLAGGNKVVIPPDILDLPIKALAPRLKRLLKKHPKSYHQVFKPV